MSEGVDTGLEQLETKLTERKTNMPPEISSQAAEVIAGRLSKDGLTTYLQWVDRWSEDDPNAEKRGVRVLNREGESVLAGLEGLSGSQVFMDEVVQRTDKMVGDDIAWNKWLETSGQATQGAIKDAVVAMDEEISVSEFVTQEKAMKATNVAQLAGWAMGDAHAADQSNFQSLFEGDDPSHPAIVEISRRRQEDGREDVTMPREVVEDLGITYQFGKARE